MPNLIRSDIAEYVDSLSDGDIFTAKDYILYVANKLTSYGADQEQVLVALASSEIKRRFRELRDPVFAVKVYVIDTYREDPSLNIGELRIVSKGSLK